MPVSALQHLHAPPNRGHARGSKLQVHILRGRAELVPDTNGVTVSDICDSGEVGLDSMLSISCINSGASKAAPATGIGET